MTRTPIENWLTQNFNTSLENIYKHFPPFETLVHKGEEIFTKSTWNTLNKNEWQTSSGWTSEDGAYLAHGVKIGTPEQNIQCLITWHFHNHEKPQKSYLKEIQHNTLQQLQEFWSDIKTITSKAKDYGHCEEDLIQQIQDYLCIINIRKKTTLQRRLHYIKTLIQKAYFIEDFIHTHKLNDIAQQFPTARNLNRKWTFYVGPTNSGKTWNAMNDLTNGSNGLYLAPLRLMALEGRDTIEKRGFPCSLMTGEDRHMIEGAKFTSSTIEMMNPEHPVDTCIIDEVQMIADPQRGWAWTRALFGAPARHLIMTGSPDAIEPLKRLSQRLGEPLEIIELHRKTELKAIQETDINIEPGDAIIAFSRRKVLELKAEYEIAGYKPAVLYGALGPEVRIQEAEKFAHKKCNILIATDVIGMGLNLPIKRVLFSEEVKYNGQYMEEISDNAIRQIGGRAGRYGHHEAGWVGALYNHDFSKRIEEVIQEPSEPLTKFKFFHWAPWEAVRDIAEHLQTQNLSECLDYLYGACLSDDPDAIVGDTTNQSEVAFLLDQTEATLKEKYDLLGSPLNIKSPRAIWIALQWVNQLAKNKEINYENFESLVEGYGENNNDIELEESEFNAKMMILYSWLALRWPENFTDNEKAQWCLNEINTHIISILNKRARAKQKKS